MPHAVLPVILNPQSGSGRAGRQGAELMQALGARGLKAELHQTRKSGHAAEIARELAMRGAEVVVAAGGDGTIHEVANGILEAGTTTALGIIPLGTGNDFAKLVLGRRRPASPYDVLAARRLALYDVGHATWDGGAEYFVNGMGSGIDVEVVRQMRRGGRLPGPLRYLFALFRALAVYEPIALAALLPDETLARRIMMMAVGNGICQGGGFYLTPRALPDDHELDLCVIDALPLWRVPFVLPLVLKGAHEQHEVVTTRALRRVRFESNGRPLYFQLDGELREPANASWLNVEVLPAALRVVVAADNES